MLSNSFDLGAIFLSGLVIKFLDDYIDHERDSNPNLYQYLGKAGLAYALIALLLAAKLNFNLTLVLFTASYGVGMFDSLDQKLPSGLPSWLEAVILIIMAIFLAGFPMTIWAILIIITIQLFDDLLDYKQDYDDQTITLVTRLGKERCLILLLLTGYLSFVFSLFLSLVTLIAALIISQVICKKLLRRNVNAVTDTN